MKRIVFIYTCIICSFATSISLTAAKQDMDLVSKYIATRTNPNAEDKKQQELMSNLSYLNTILSSLETKQEALAVHALDEHLMKKIDYLCKNSSITAFGLHRALRMLAEPMTETNLKVNQDYKTELFAMYKKNKGLQASMMQKSAKLCIEKIAALCDEMLNPSFGTQAWRFGTRMIKNSISANMLLSGCTSTYNMVRERSLWPLVFGIFGVSVNSLAYTLSEQIQQATLEMIIEKESSKFLEKIENVIDSFINLEFTGDSQENRVTEKLTTLSSLDLCAALAECIESKKATLVTLEKKSNENDIKSGIEKACTETKNQAITLSPNDKGNGFGQNFLIMKKSKTQTQDSMYDVAANIVCAHAFNIFLGDNMKKDAITMPFIDVYHLIVTTKTYSTDKDFTFLEEIYLPKKTLIKKALSS